MSTSGDCFDRIVAFAADDFTLVDDLTGATFYGREGLHQWLRSTTAKPADRASPLRFAEIVDVCDGKVARIHAIRDTSTFLRQYVLSDE